MPDTDQGSGDEQQEDHDNMKSKAYDEDERYDYNSQAESAQRRHKAAGIPAGLQTDTVAGKSRQKHADEYLENHAG